jgi:hypothetical protein
VLVVYKDSRISGIIRYFIMRKLGLIESILEGATDMEVEAETERVLRVTCYVFSVSV